MPVKRAFISFDFDPDEDLSNLLARQANEVPLRIAIETRDRGGRAVLQPDRAGEARRGRSEGIPGEGGTRRDR